VRDATIVAVAFCTAAELLGKHPGDRVAVAFPDTPLHREYLGRINEAAKTLGIGVFWAGADKSVQEVGAQ
jgi:hypothetical protein